MRWHVQHNEYSLGMDWEDRVLPSIDNEVVKAVVVQYNAEPVMRLPHPCHPKTAAVACLTCCCLPPQSPAPASQLPQAQHKTP